MENVLNDLQERWDGLTPLTQDILIIIGVILATWVIRQLVQPLIVSWLRRLSARTQTQWDDVVIAALDAPLRYIMMAVVLESSRRAINLEQPIGSFIGHVARTLVIIAIFLIIYKVVSRITQTPLTMRRITSLQIEDALLPFVRTGLRFLLIVLAVVIIIEEWGYNVNGLIAGLGVGGLAVALAAQDTLSNLFGFSMIVGDRPFVEGEYIDSDVAKGTVEQVGLRSTRIRQTDQALVTVPNNKLANTSIINWSRLTKRRMNAIIGLSYETDSNALRSLLHHLRDMLQNRALVETDSVVVIFTNFSENSLDILVRCYILLTDWAEFHLEQEQIFLEIMDIVEEMGLSIAFPSRTLYLEPLPETVRMGRKPQPTAPQPDETYKPESDDLSQNDYR